LGALEFFGEGGEVYFGHFERVLMEVAFDALGVQAYVGVLAAFLCAAIEQFLHVVFGTEGLLFQKSLQTRFSLGLGELQLHLIRLSRWGSFGLLFHKLFCCGRACLSTYKFIKICLI
jgi:hypothetical protein